MGIEFAYQITQPEIEEGKQKYFFESLSKDTNFQVIKVIEYSYINQNFEGLKVFNLGFGDYNKETDEIRDDIVTNNGDAYKVFNTVLNSIPQFFNSNQNAALFVSGSDSADEFEGKCKTTCIKKCTDKCKKKGQRIKTYCYYVSKNFEELSNEFIFKGGLTSKVTKTTSLVDFEKGAIYDAVLVIKRN